MAHYPISLIPFFGNPSLSGYVLKAYRANTSTLLQMATDNTGGTLVNTIALNASGWPAVSGNVVIPHVDRAYKVSLYPSQAAADANSGATWNIDNLTPYNITSDLTFSGTTIGTTANSDITLDPNGTGEINLNATTNITTADVQNLQIGSVAVTPTAEELNQIDGLGLAGYITGFIPTTAADADHDLTFSGGSCRNAADTITVKSTWSTLTKQIDAAWAEGTNQGGMATGSVAADTVYYYNLIRKNADTSVLDIVIDVSSSQANTPSGWTFIREVYRLRTNSSANTLAASYHQLNGGAVEVCPGSDCAIAVNATQNPGTSLVTFTAGGSVTAMTPPPSCHVEFTWKVTDGSTVGFTYGLLRETAQANSAPTSTNFNLSSGDHAATGSATVNLLVFIDASRQATYRLSQSTTDHFTWITINRWVISRN